VRKLRSLAVVAFAGLLLLTACGGGSEPSPSATPAASTQAEIFLAAADDPMADPFTTDTAIDVGTANQTPTASPTNTAASEVTARTGTDPELYAAADRPACDVEKLISDLQANPTARGAWADIRGIQESEIPEYLRGLAPVVLRYDTRVTNHRYTDGSGFAFQAVLEAGTAVLVDNTGMPVVRCACGNPLLAPKAATDGATYQGTAWPGFSPDTVIVVTPGATVTVIVYIRINTTVTIDVPVSSGPGDGSATPSSGGSGTAGATATATATAPTGAPASGDYTSCARRYGELVRDLTLNGGMDAGQAEQWAAKAKQAAALASSGDLAGAYAICWESVSEMEAELATR